ncbi:MAG: RNA binding S1 domain protein [Parcubacteria group bacterium GW2011_GWA2_47_7]|nr:MAG: RNA binding S1 domain protein [Parcubacteria group bacterium GW2011_GWA2_47_7]
MATIELEEEVIIVGGEQVLSPDHPMTKYMTEIVNRPEPGEIVEGPVIKVSKKEVYINMPPYGIGIIYGREYMNARDLVKHMNIGDVITAKVVESENEDGYVELSLKEARQSLIWGEAEDYVRKKTILDLVVKDANKGGLMLDWQGISGFLPASQLSGDHYPRVTDGDKDRILEELKRLVGEKISVVMITAVPKEGKLIFSEKEHNQKEKEEIVSKYQLGSIVDGEITGIVDFGAFMKIEEGLEGLIHISEMDWGLVDDPRKLFKVGEKLKAQIIEIKDNKVSLSVKVLKENPWKSAEKKYKKGDVVKGVVIKFNKYGALASIEEGVAGLVHVSEFGTEEKLRTAMELGKVYPFTITLFEPKDQRMTLSFTTEKTA